MLRYFCVVTFLVCFVCCSSSICFSDEQSDFFTNENVKQMLADYYKKQGPSLAFWVENIIRFDNFTVIKHKAISDSEHYVDFKFDRVYKLNTVDISKNFSQEQLDAAFGSYKDIAVLELELNDYRIGELDTDPHLAAIFEKGPEGWSLKELGFPND